MNRHSIKSFVFVMSGLVCGSSLIAKPIDAHGLGLGTFVGTAVGTGAAYLVMERNSENPKNKFFGSKYFFSGDQEALWQQCGSEDDCRLGIEKLLAAETEDEKDIARAELHPLMVRLHLAKRKAMKLEKEENDRSKEEEKKRKKEATEREEEEFKKKHELSLDELKNKINQLELEMKKKEKEHENALIKADADSKRNEALKDASFQKAHAEIAGEKTRLEKENAERLCEIARLRAQLATATNQQD